MRFPLVSTAAILRGLGSHLALLPLVMIVPACTVGPDYHPASPTVLKVTGRYNALPVSVGAEIDLGTWWTSFNDPVLSRLIAISLSANNDIDAARARLRAARAAVRGARGALLPVVGASAGASATRTLRGANSDGDTFSAGFDASWEADVFGGNKRALEAARATADGSAAMLHGVQLSIAAEVAANYIDVRSAQAAIAIARTNLGYQDDTVEIAGWRVQAGLVGSLDLEQSRVLRAQTAASIPALETALAAADNRIAVLTGEAPGWVTALLADPAPIPLGPDAIAAGLPADLLQRRPDVVASERLLAAETARIGVATAQLYPALRLSGSLTTSSLSLGGLGESILGGLASAITAPIFQGGQIRAQIAGQNATADAALAGYRQAVLIALEDVENALVALQNARAREDLLTVAESSARTSLFYARSQYRAGLIDFATLLEAQRSLLSTQDGRNTARAARATALIQLCKALGGGWQRASLAPGVTQ